MKNFLAREFEIKDLGSLKYFLGMEVARLEAGITITQRKFGPVERNWNDRLQTIRYTYGPYQQVRSYQGQSTSGKREISTAGRDCLKNRFEVPASRRFRTGAGAL